MIANHDYEKPKVPPEIDKPEDDGGQKALDEIKKAFKPKQFTQWLS